MTGHEPGETRADDSYPHVLLRAFGSEHDVRVELLGKIRDAVLKIALPLERRRLGAEALVETGVK
ncbi:hypothetical protein [Bradyrhizobium tunisiense]|uniref:hypothetical protein n=1 Tax=Bradyrhizobium tunisiense TaxID=3278709 RepID=UPI0035D6845A